MGSLLRNMKLTLQDNARVLARTAYNKWFHEGKKQSKKKG